ncbi:hypothetical protein F4861DRAFT_543540 [Xylaria intraflava]|nr:hypothetical protein F4861DRAFT_543540 [Xylaria intraflava]
MACIFINDFTGRLQRLIGLKSKAHAAAAGAAADEKRSSLQISAPFNFKHETVSLPGLSEDELEVLKEKAMASVRFSSPRKAPKAPKSSGQAPPPVVQVTPGTPVTSVTPEDNVI